MARLTAAQRKKLPDSAFAGPGRSYPINDPSHARNALSRASQFASPTEKAHIMAKVNKKYPGIGAPGGAKYTGRRKPGEVSDVRSSNPVMGGHNSKAGYAIPYSQDTSRSPYKRGNRAN